MTSEVVKMIRIKVFWKSAFVLCFFIACFTEWYKTQRTQRKFENKKVKIGLLVPFDDTKFSIDNDFKLKTANDEFAFKVYGRNGYMEKRPLNSDLNANNKVASTETFTQIVNRLAHRSVKDGMDYLILIGNGTFSNVLNRDSIKYSIKKIREHIVSDIGIVVASEMRETQLTRPYFIVINKSHFEVFKHFFPTDLDFDNMEAIQWITDIYKPYHITELKVQSFTEPLQLSVQFKFGNSFNDKPLEQYRNKITNHIFSKQSVFIVSYSLFGSNTRYTDGALENTELIRTIYPSWRVLLFHDNTVPLDIISTVCEKTIAKCINMTGSVLKNKMSWRFLVASVPFVSRYIIRDIDSRLSAREKAAVDEWIASGKKFHVMRDHPSHSSYAMSGGMWGGTREAIPNMESLLQREVMNDNYVQDMDFLNSIVWPIAQHSVYQHDSFSCDRFGGGHPFPSKRVGLEHVGSVYINGEMRKTDTDILNNTKTPAQCQFYSKRNESRFIA
ncbi:uncharacterized protein LOC123552226 isoform X1 [Mercenaria mercenaria]|uniref:uncharacterized protein LOC123552226 isoform X1 n=1 Tax=Mercenaria mercenaria TaxID=6596 RepID=UPI001E1DB967|nr:uncharacterized protein LOC123552226 isoform X1 [Mercenaria mercenaria]XP_045197654.1 uncharacterized protein LOC123552226 isoform X1 [Mercenaria mercenaria]